MLKIYARDNLGIALIGMPPNQPHEKCVNKGTYLYIDYPNFGGRHLERSTNLLPLAKGFCRSRLASDAATTWKVSASASLALRIARQVHGIYVCGQTGEGLLQTVDQRKEVAEIAVANSPKGKQAVVHVGAYRPHEAFGLARPASKIGAAAVGSLPLIGAYSFEQVRAYYQKLAAATDLPVLIYFFPNICPAIQTADQIIELMQTPNVVGCVAKTAA